MVRENYFFSFCFYEKKNHGNAFWGYISNCTFLILIIPLDFNETFNFLEVEIMQK